MVPISETEFHVGRTGMRAVWETGAAGERTGFRIMEGARVVEELEAVEPAEITNATLQDYVGTYHSDDAETTLTFEIRNDNELWIGRRPADEARLRPSYEDAFNTPIGFMRFMRNAAGEVEYVTLYQGRVYDMRFYPVGR